MKEVVKYLRRLDVPSDIEHPGYISATYLGFTFNLGTANGPWGVELMGPDGTAVNREGVASQMMEPAAVAAKLLSVMYDIAADCINGVQL